jgi:hypothetical protein
MLTVIKLNYYQIEFDGVFIFGPTMVIKFPSTSRRSKLSITFK